MPANIPCLHCGDTSPADACFCITCGVALTQAHTGKTIRLAAFTIARPPQSRPFHRIRSIPLEVWGFLSLITVCITISPILNIIQKNDPQYIREMATRTTIQTRVATYEGRWVSDLDTVIHGYMQAMQAQDRVRALSLFGHNRTSPDYLDMLLRDQRALFADYTEIFVHAHGVDWLHMQAEAQADIRYANGGTAKLQAGFVFEDNQWKLGYAQVTQDSKPYATPTVPGR